MKFFLRLLLGSLGLSATCWLAGCTVYAPMQPTVSGIRAVGEAEIGASIQGSGRAEASAVVSPAPGFLLAGAVTYRPRLERNKTYFTTRQWEAAAGAYVPIGPRWVISGLGGYGYASTDRIWGELLGNSPDLHARYAKYFGQFCLHYGTKDDGAGLVIRVSQLKFDELSFYSPYYSGQVQMQDMWRHELLIYGRPVFGNRASSRWATMLQGSVGVSLSSKKPLDDQTPGYSEYNRNIQPVLLGSLGLGFARRVRQPPVTAPH